MTSKSPALIAVALAAAAYSQQPVFEVATIKPNTSTGGVSSIRLDRGMLFVENATLRKCIAGAYGLSEDRDYAIRGPEWLSIERYDIVAKFAPDTPLAQVRVMLQNLLASRFGLKTHREVRDVPVYALTASKNGIRMQESQPGTPGTIGMTAGHLKGQSATIDALADRLSGSLFQLGRPVLDRTGLAGNYDFTLDWTPDNAPGADDSKPSLFTALEEQLGLRLEAQKSQMEVLVVDSMERKPTAN